MSQQKKRMTKAVESARSLMRWAGILQAAMVLLTVMALAGGLVWVVPEARRTFQNAGSLKLYTMVFLTLLVLVGALQQGVFVRLRSRLNEIQKRSMLDGLTSIMNRSSFEETLQEESRRAGRYRFPLCLCLLDLDNFKSFNEAVGRKKADEMLRQFSHFMQASVRFSDAVGRYGSDEFCILLPHTDVVGSEKFLSRFLIQVQERLDITFSAGITAYRTGEEPADLLARAEAALHQAKSEGKKSIRCIIGSDNEPAVISF